ncbi:Eco57I restriction-modification methylase domain-containing protein [Marinilabilia salmonicolor]|uniref:Eco57I restriction-modification methylase domain-containing protein n=1 Tax=Marinilabilia salmonicolor TaxID=989 RepID=UPI00029ADEAF|nr:TaqI-like C-terminal specificity domain-containing protein [Marinilabilia salmonicolor]
MITKEEAYKKIQELVTRFGEQIDSYKQTDYNETLTRRDFIDPLFKALGWDVDNSQGYAEAYREVIHEDRVKVGKATKAPDYSFRLGGGKRLFFVEAKKPSISIKDDITVAYQIRRYGWSAKLPISIITDFEEFAVYDCTKKPNPTDKSGVARIKYINFKDYLTEFEYLWDTFSKEHVLKGSFDKYIQSDTVKKGTATVDKEFLSSLDNWRTYLATTISLRNKELDEDEINYAVQLTIDRLIFLRIAEDRGVEQYGQLKNSVNQKGESYQNLFFNFKKADEKYNSGLFDFSKDVISEKLLIDNKVIKTIVNEMYYPESPYEFSVISVEILGSAYEQFLGKVIRITPAHHAKIEEKPEVRKAGGVYYTPQYVVDYIVKNTIGKLIDGKTPKQIEKIKIADPACGSGSFLIGAYQYLLDYHKNYYTENGTKTGKKDSPTTPEGNLTSAEKKKILLNNIYGVDIDLNAVEVTKLSLLLKCMEGETETSIAQQQKLWHERILPTLDENIKSGNSLVETDFYDAVLDFGEEKKIKPFNWQKAFPDVFINGGFDVIIGNPPYVMLQNLETREVFDYALNKYISAKYKIDTYQLFTERSIKLLKQNGLLGFITPNTFLKNIHSEPLRKYVLENTLIKEFLLFNYSVFSSASVDTCVFIFEKAEAKKNSHFDVLKSDIEFVVEKISDIHQNSLFENNRLDFNLLTSDIDNKLLSKIVKNSMPLSTYCGAYFGIQTFDRKTYVSKEKVNKNYEPVIDGGNIEPYYLKTHSEYVNYLPEAIKSGGNESIYRQDRICIRQIGTYPISTFVKANIFTLNTIYNVYLKQDNIANLKFLLGIINSNVTKYFWKKTNSDEKKTFPKIKKEAILSIPIPAIKDTSKALHDNICNLVDQLLQLNEEAHSVKLETKRQSIENKIDYCNEKINSITYQLFDLKEDGISIVENVE